MASDDAIPDGLPAEIWDELLTARLEEARAQPRPKVIAVADDFWERRREGATGAPRTSADSKPGTGRARASSDLSARRRAV
jgi:hypothetical protein